VNTIGTVRVICTKRPSPTARSEELLKKKQSGQKVEAPREREPSKVGNLMDALRRSVETERGGGERRKPATGRSSDHRAPKKA
jgi:non-homologous end joining protein Ku